MQQKLDNLDKSKSEEIRAKLDKKRVSKPSVAVKEKPRYQALVVKKSRDTRFMIDNKMIRKKVAKTNKSVLEFKKKQFYGDRIARTDLKSLLNKY